MELKLTLTELQFWLMRAALNTEIAEKMNESKAISQAKIDKYGLHSPESELNDQEYRECAKLHSEEIELRHMLASLDKQWDEQAQ